MLKAIVAAACLAVIPTLAQSAAVPPPAAVQAAPALTARANEIVTILNGAGDYSATFSSTFRDAVPKDKFDAIAAQLKTQAGSATGVHSIAPTSPWQATVVVDYQRALVTMLLVVDPADPHQVTGLRITGAEPRNDSAAALKSDFARLPGASGFGIYALSSDSIRPVVEVNGDAAAPIGSAFKLWTLAEAAREVAAGTRRWSDVIAVGPHSLPSGILQSWPDHAPVTLQTAATLMISISDNTAADTLLTTLGRDRVDAMVKAVGVAEPARTLPVLTTREAFELKLPANSALVSRWASAAPEARRQLLAANARTLASPIDAAVFAGTPMAIDQVEWFASPSDMARTLNWLRLHGDTTTRAILAVNPGTDSTTAGKFRYVGYKGGSEAGVISMNYLVQTKAGNWFAVTGNWHNASAAVDETNFAMLMNRALLLVS
jgi:beta-lactamase class A